MPRLILEFILDVLQVSGHGEEFAELCAVVLFTDPAVFASAVSAFEVGQAEADGVLAAAP